MKFHDCFWEENPKAGKFAYRMKKQLRETSIFLITTLGVITALSLFSGCAQIGFPTGGPKDSIAPKLVQANPTEKATHFNGTKITLNFDEYIELRDLQNNLLVAPLPKKQPEVTYKLRSVTIKLRDTLIPNTTYAIDFGNSIADINEGNPFKNYTYVFSTGAVVDSLELPGNVLLAETGKADTTMMAILYREAPDTAVWSRRPDYAARIDREGKFKFHHLSPGRYRLYALKDGDGNKYYNISTELFAFADTTLQLPYTGNPVHMQAYAAEKESEKKPAGMESSEPDRPGAGKSLRIQPKLNFNRQPIISDLEIGFSRKIKSIDLSKLQFLDSNNRQLSNVRIGFDSSNNRILLKHTWQEDYPYQLILPKDFAQDTTGAGLFKNDTLRFKTNTQDDYGSLNLRFIKFDSSLHPVLLFYQNEKLIRSIPLIQPRYAEKLMDPGEYEIRILYDRNRNGKWDPGDYKIRLQPERIKTFDKRLTIKAKWENEREIEL